MTQAKSLFDFTKSPSAIKTILWSGLIAGVLDAIAGIIVYYIYFDLNPLQVLQFIASGVYGPTAIGGGVAMIIVGTFFHFLIAYVCAIIYFYASLIITLLKENSIVFGLFYGIGIWLVMNTLVLPASNIPKSPFDTSLAIIGILWHMVLVGLPISIISANYFTQKSEKIY